VDLSNLQSEIGSTDVFEIQLRAFDWFLADGPPSGDADGYSDRIGLDNISIYGDHVACIPEPGAALLGLMALVPLVLRRRR
jgi:MYXO-CTERM domain-containing protein